MVCCLMLLSRGTMSRACSGEPQNAAVANSATDSESISRTAADPPLRDTDQENSIGTNFLKHFLDDQKAIWTSPAGLRASDATWLMPLGLATAGMLATDTDFSKHLSNSPSRLKNSNTFSNYGLGSMVAAGAGFYLLGHITHDDHKRETGLLAGEAAIDSFAVDYALKYALGRERPQQDNYQGNFWQGRRLLSIGARHRCMGDCKRDRARVSGTTHADHGIRYGVGCELFAASCEAAFPFGCFDWQRDRLVHRPASLSHPSRSGSLEEGLGNGYSEKTSARTAVNLAIWVQPTFPWIVGSMRSSHVSRRSAISRPRWRGCSRGPAWNVQLSRWKRQTI